ncbi:MAG: bifunctional folylpolyglutamate synthase/dihydrofolate synthase [Bacteroidetes bacterium]|nr:bifunctional folylpolyglutamate synthase/dihydrofolate synthase [Bacteroidota bacterium]
MSRPRRTARRSAPRPGYAATLRYLYDLQVLGIKTGLRNIRTLTAHAGHPERSFPCFHCAGTNGKGSTSSLLASMLTEAGYRTGLYTSPHILEFTERIRIDGEPISEKTLVEYTQQLRPIIEKTGATFFEATTCIAFQYFADKQVDVAVIETGLGGRLDATNVVMPLVSIITNIGLDHREILGDSIRRIAREKAGIIKPGTPLVTMAEGEALDVIRAAARRCRTGVFSPYDLLDIQRVERRSDGAFISLRRKPVNLESDRSGHRKGASVRGQSRVARSRQSDRWRHMRVWLPLAGEHQVANAALAVSALELARSHGLFRKAGPDAIRKGMAHVRQNTGLRGRMERVRAGWADLRLDVGHNPEGIRAVAAAFLTRKMRFPYAIFGAMKDKDTGAMLAALAPCVDTVVAVRPRIQRAATTSSLVRKGKRLGLDIRHGGSVVQGIKKVQSLVQRAGGVRPPRVLVIGSHYLAGEALSALENKT